MIFLCEVKACLICRETEMSEAYMQFVCLDDRLIKSDTKTNIYQNILSVSVLKMSKKVFIQLTMSHMIYFEKLKPNFMLLFVLNISFNLKQIIVLTI